MFYEEQGADRWILDVCAHGRPMAGEFALARGNLANRAEDSPVVGYRVASRLRHGEAKRDYMDIDLYGCRSLLGTRLAQCCGENARNQHDLLAHGKDHYRPAVVCNACDWHRGACGSEEDWTHGAEGNYLL